MLPIQDSKERVVKEGSGGDMRLVNKAVYGARDIREKQKGGLGEGGDRDKRIKRRGKEVCSVCMGVCCSAARELVVNLANMGEIGVNPKVLIDLIN